MEQIKPFSRPLSIYCLFRLTISKRPKMDRYGTTKISYLGEKSVGIQQTAIGGKNDHIMFLLALSNFREIYFIRSLNNECPSIKYYYMGYYIHSCEKMRYKVSFFCTTR